MKFIGSLLLIAALAACSSEAPQAPRLEPGAWGGEGVGLLVDATHVEFAFDCAGGTVDGTIAVAPDGSFDVLGTWANYGNAFGVDHSPKPARYVGKVTGTHMHFTLKMPPDNSTTTVVYDASLGATPHVIAC